MANPAMRAHFDKAGVAGDRSRLLTRLKDLVKPLKLIVPSVHRAGQ